MIRILLFICCCLLALGDLSAQAGNIPAPPQSGAILLLGATAHLGNGQVIQNAAIGFDKGKLTLVADASTARIDRSAYQQVIDVQGKHVYPGFILAATDVGIAEVGSLRALNDDSERESYNPSLRALIAYNTDSEVMPTLRFNGILMAQSTPQGGIITGNSSIFQLDAWNWEDAVLKTDDGMHVNWPARQIGPQWWLGETAPRRNENYDKTINELQALFAEAKAYGQQTNKVMNLGLQSMQGLFDGSKTFFLHTDDAKGMMEGISLAREAGVKRIVVVGGAEALLIQDFLKEQQVPVILTNIHSLPRRDHEDTVFPYKLPKLLHDAGIDFCITYTATNSRARNLPFMAGTAVAYGLPYEKGVQAISGNVARILGIADRAGTLEVGKDATLFISQGDALDMRGNIVDQAYIQGRKVMMEGRQQQLYKKYSEKYGHKTE